MNINVNSKGLTRAECVEQFQAALVAAREMSAESFGEAIYVMAAAVVDLGVPVIVGFYFSRNWAEGAVGRCENNVTTVV